MSYLPSYLPLIIILWTLRQSQIPNGVCDVLRFLTVGLKLGTPNTGDHNTSRVLCVNMHPLNLKSVRY